MSSRKETDWKGKIPQQWREKNLCLYVILQASKGFPFLAPASCFHRISWVVGTLVTHLIDGEAEVWTI